MPFNNDVMFLGVVLAVGNLDSQWEGITAFECSTQENLLKEKMDGTTCEVVNQL